MILRKPWVVLGLSLAAIAGSIVLVSLEVGSGRILHSLVHPHLIWLVGLILGQAAAYLGYALAYKELFGLDFKPAARRTFHGFSPLVTLGGFAYDTKLMGRAGVQKVAALGVAEYILLAPAVLAAAIYALSGGQVLPDSLTIPWTAGVPAGIAAAVIVIVFRKRISRQLAAAIDKIFGEFKGLSPLSWLFILLGTAVYWACELLVLASALNLFGVKLAIDALIIAYATGYVLTRRSLPASLAGVTIILMMLVLHWTGVPYGEAFLATYTYLAINIIMPIAYLASWELRGRFPAKSKV